MPLVAAAGAPDATGFAAVAATAADSGTVTMPVSGGFDRYSGAHRAVDFLRKAV
jgi:hypothetical protein